MRDPERRLWMDIEVVDAPVADAPRRQPRRRMKWKEFFRKMRARELKRARKLEARLRQARSGFYVQPGWTSKPPALGFRVTLNGRELGRIGVGDPGSLSIDVAVMQRPDKHTAYLMIDGGDRVGQHSWRSRTWPRETRGLKVGDRVRIEVVAPVRLSSGRLQKLETMEPTNVAGIARELKELRKRSKSGYYRKLPHDMLRADRDRPPARRYPRGLMRDLSGEMPQ